MDFLDYTLPAHLIAQKPSPVRDQRLLVVRRETGHLDHHRFADLPQILRPGDLLILNDTRVLPARLLGRRQRTGGKWEGLFLRQLAEGAWEMLCQTGGRLVAGEIIVVEPGPLELRLLEKSPDGHWRVQPGESGSPAELLSRHGHVPLPPYIRKGLDDPADRDRYQTVYARREGAVAAPTAGLHFTAGVFARLKERGVDCASVTLHVGLGTFQPMQTEDVRRHALHSEWGELPAATVTAMAACRCTRRPCHRRRYDECAYPGKRGSFRRAAPWSGETNLFIYPPYHFRAIDGLITNFHLPRTSLLLLVGAFAGVDLLRQAYMTAIEMQYRFFSYGDAMIIL